MSRYEAVILDVDGTIVRGETLLPGAGEGLALLERAGLSRLLFSNNPTRGAGHYQERLAAHELDIEIDPENVLTSATVTAAFLAENHGNDVIYLVGEDRLHVILEEAGLVVTDDPTEATVVLGSIDRELCFDQLSEALVALEDGSPFYGTDPDVTIPTDEGTIPGSGAILASMEAIAGRPPKAVLGKPSEIAANAALARLDVDSTETLVVGDRLDTDIELGRRAGMSTALVTTGITSRADLERAASRPDHVIDSLAELESIVCE